MKKLYLSLCLALVSILFSSFVAFAAPCDVVVSLQIDNPLMEVNGGKEEIDKGRGTAPVVVNGRTLVPIRAIVESFGGEVLWDDRTKAITLKLEDDTITLYVNKKTAQLNGKSKTLDVAPAIINERTFLPIRFVAEGFNLGVAWNDKSKTVSIVRNGFDDAEYDYLMSVLPSYTSKSYAVINNNKPFFKDYELIESSFEYYSNLDELGRCDVCMASVGKDLMPTEKRGSISSVIPTGWINVKYDNVDGGYLYNRCHLIGFQLTGENANKRNLITGTRYLNVEAMLPFENIIDDYVEKTGNNVMYRTTPVFTENNLVASGVLLEAYSVEDNGKGITFCVFCYNVQPGIKIDYATGKSSVKEILDDGLVLDAVYRTPSGKRYHLDAQCGGKNSYRITFEKALKAGLTPCGNCANILK